MPLARSPGSRTSISCAPSRTRASAACGENVAIDGDIDTRLRKRKSAFDVPHHSPALLDLPVGQRVDLVGIGILALSELELQRRADQLVVLAQVVFQIALVAVRQAFDAIAVNHRRGGMGTARMRKAQLGGMST